MFVACDGVGGEVPEVEGLSIFISSVPCVDTVGESGGIGELDGRVEEGKAVGPGTLPCIFGGNGVGKGN